MSHTIRTVLSAVTCCASGAAVALVASATAWADPPLPTPQPPPPPVESTTVQAAGDAPAPTPPDGIPHLASPDALPPGSTMEPQDNDSPNVSYLKDLWQAVQNQEISGKEALLLGIAQRGMNTPYPDQAPGPNVPSAPVDPALAPPPPAPAPDPALPWLPPPPAPPASPLPPTP